MPQTTRSLHTTGHGHAAWHLAQPGWSGMVWYGRAKAVNTAMDPDGDVEVDADCGVEMIGDCGRGAETGNGLGVDFGFGSGRDMTEEESGSTDGSH